MNSGLSHPILISNNLRLSGKLRKIWNMLAVAISLVLLIAAFAPSASAKKNDSANPTVESVNLREKDWVFSVYSVGNKDRYASVTRYDGDGIDIEIPSSLGNVEVREIRREAFYNNPYLTSVVIPDSVEKIGKYAFSGCIGLSRVTFPSSLESVGEGAFYGCRSLTEAAFPAGTERIGGFAFQGCVHLKKAVFPASLRSIGDSAFEGCSMLEKLSFGEKMESVGDRAFSGCLSLRSVKLPGAEKLGSGVFMKCTALEKAVFGEKLTELPSDAFRGCVALKNADLGSALSLIGESAFEGCVSLKTFPQFKNLTEIRSLAFMNCSSLEVIEIGSSVQSIFPGAFAGCTSLSGIIVSAENGIYRSFGGCLYTKEGKTLVLCPQGFDGLLKTADDTEKIAAYAASGCTLISGVALNNIIKEIGGGAFLGCTDITTVSVPDSVEYIGNAAFGMFLSDDEARREPYFRVYASEDSAAAHYSTEREMSFIPYNETLFASSERVVMKEGEKFQLKYGFASRKKADVSWESSDESVVKVKNGKLSAVAKGSAEVTLSAEGFEPRIIKIIVTEPQKDGKNKERTYDRKLVYCGEREELSSFFSQIIDPIFSANRFWYSSEPKVATVGDDGKVEAHSAGNAVVICRMPDGSEHIVTLTVTEKPAEFAVLPPEDELVVGETQPLRVRLYPSHSEDGVTWKSDDEKIVTVDEKGMLTAVGQGDCTVSAVTSSGLKSSVELRCVIPAERLSLNLEERALYQGKEFNLTASVMPENAKQRIRWRSSDPTVATVNSKGKVRGRSFGSATIYAETSGGLAAECRVFVMTRAEELSLDVKKLKINRGSEYKLNAIVRPSYSPETTDRCTWNSTNENVAIVDENGIVTAVGAGKCIINCRTSGNLISKCQVQVRLPAESVKIEAEKDSVYIGEVLPLHVVIQPEDSTDSVEWSVDNSEIARVTDGGSVKGKSMGTAVITVKLVNDVTGSLITDSFEIKVRKKAASVKLNKSSLSLLAGENDFLTFIAAPDDCNDTVRWYSTDERVASVREDGLITAQSAGTCRICIEMGSGATASCHITVN